MNHSSIKETFKEKNVNIYYRHDYDHKRLIFSQQTYDELFSHNLVDCSNDPCATKWNILVYTSTIIH